jgi:hypothetical protein
MDPIWYGTEEERRDLLASIERNCMCGFDAKGARISVCEAHTLLVQRQRVLDGLVFARRIARLFIREEWRLGDATGMGLE